MARLGTGWLLSVFLVNLTTCSIQPGRPVPPSPPRCFMPYDDDRAFSKGIHCSWDPGPQWETHSSYTLHWASDHKRGHMKVTNTTGYIERQDVCRHCEMAVWVRAESERGSSTSGVTSFNTANIVKPAYPIIDSHSQDPLEIYWSSRCDLLSRSEGDCDVRHRAEPERVWSEEEEGFRGVYPLETVRPFTVYQFQVRCCCAEPPSLMSDWTPVYRVESEAAAPVGMMDVWKDCETSHKNTGCVLMWKKLSRPQARGHISGYVVELFYPDVESVLVDVPAAEPGARLVCDGTRCSLNVSTLGATAANVTAVSVHGATTPAALPLTPPGTESAGGGLRLRMDSQRLSASWDGPSSHSDDVRDDVRDYVVQYKQAGLPPTHGFDWIRLGRNQTSGSLTGQFKNYTAYQVSVFTVTQQGRSRLLSSAVGYAFQGTPSKVQLFSVATIKYTSVTLSWLPTPLPQQRGVVLFYLIGVDGPNVHSVFNVSGPRDQEPGTLLLEQLRPGQNYEAWIRAVTEAGPGPSTTTQFKTANHDQGPWFLLLFPLTVLILVVTMCLVKSNWIKKESFCLEKVPDPGNSNVFQQIKDQLNDSWNWNFSPVAEASPKISTLEVVPIIPKVLRSRSLKASGPDQLMEGLMRNKRPQKGAGSWKGDAVSVEDWEGTEFRNGFRTEDYSNMVDSDGEGDVEVDVSSDSSGGGISCSGYEKHFMPTAQEVLWI